MLAAMRPVLLLLLISSFLGAAQNAGNSSWQLYSFCYSTYNSLPTSPYLYWSFLTQGTLNVTFSNSSVLRTVTDAIAQRQAYYAGNTTTTTAISGVAPVGSYLGNDNSINLQPTGGSGYLLLDHVLVLMANASLPFAAGMVMTTAYPQGLPLLALVNRSMLAAAEAGVAEWHNPINDGEVTIVQSTWQLAPASSGFVNTYAGCTAQLPAPLVNAASDVALYYSSGPASLFCYDLSAGPGDGTTDGGAWNIAASGMIQTSGYLGLTASGLPARLITGMNGTRSWVFENRTALTTNIILASVTAPLEALANSTTLDVNIADVATNVLYSSYPYIDNQGVALFASGDVAVEATSNASTAVVRLYINGTTDEFFEDVLDNASGAMFVDRTGTFYTQNVTAAQGGGTMLNATAWAQQCAIDYGTTAQYEWCYYIDNSAVSVSSQRGVILAFGLVMATGPQPQEGRQALRLLKLTGMRLVMAMPLNGVAATTSQNIKHVKYINQDTSDGQHNDDLVYLSQPALDYNGFLVETNGDAFVFNGTSGNTDLRVTNTPFGISEFDSDGTYKTQAMNGTVSGFFFQPQTSVALTPISQCAAYYEMIGGAPSLLAYSFCYVRSTIVFNVTMSALLWLYPSPVSYQGRSGLAVAWMNGTRMYQDNTGTSTINPIIGPSADWYAKQLNPSESYDQLIYVNSSSATMSPAVDAQGLLYQISGRAETPVGLSYGPYIVRLYANASAAGGYTEEIETGVVNGVWEFSEMPIATVAVVADGGRSARSGTVLSSACGFNMGAVTVTTSSSTGPAANPHANGAERAYSGAKRTSILLVLWLLLMRG